MRAILALVVMTATPGSAQSLAERAAQQYATADEKAAARALLVIPGIDISDASVVRSAAIFCGQSDDCGQRFKDYRDGLLSMYYTNRGRRDRIRSILHEEERDGGIDWNSAQMRITSLFGDGVVTAPRSTITCSTRYYAASSSTTCSGF